MISFNIGLGLVKGAQSANADLYPPAGYILLLDADGQPVVDMDGFYLMEAV